MHLDIDLGFGVHLESLSCRIYGINSPELATAAGKVARDFAQSLLPVGSRCQVISHGWDKFGGRFDGDLKLPDGSDFATRMVAAGQAVAI